MQSVTSPLSVRSRIAVTRATSPPGALSRLPGSFRRQSQSFAQVFGYGLHSGAVLYNLASSQPDRAAAHAGNNLRDVRDEQYRAAVPLYLRHLVETLLPESCIANGQHLVDDENIGVDMRSHRESKTHAHARGIVFDRRIDELSLPR
jgi:hypothetical protein